MANKAFLTTCGVSCSLISVWGVIQLSIMGLFYRHEAVTLIEDTEAHEYEYSSYEEYIQKTRDNYQNTAMNCWFAAIGYVISLVLSCICLRKAKMDSKMKMDKKMDDELVCKQKPIVPAHEVIKKKKKFQAFKAFKAGRKTPTAERRPTPKSSTPKGPEPLASTSSPRPSGCCPSVSKGEDASCDCRCIIL